MRHPAAFGFQPSARSAELNAPGWRYPIQKPTAQNRRRACQSVKASTQSAGNASVASVLNFSRAQRVQRQKPRTSRLEAAPYPKDQPASRFCRTNSGGSSSISYPCHARVPSPKKLLSKAVGAALRREPVLKTLNLWRGESRLSKSGFQSGLI